MATLFFGVRIPNRAYEYLQLENVDLQKSVYYLKNEISKKINYEKDDIQLVYCGNILDDNENINEIQIKPNSTIHVFKKATQPKISISNTTYTDEDCQRIANIFGTVTGTQLSVKTRMNILQKIITEYPEFYCNLGAQALIRDSVLFHSLDKVEVIRKISKNYSVICDAAEFIVKTTKKELAKNEIDNFNEELFSSSSSEEENSSNPNQSEQARIRRISRDQLAAALMLAGSASLNSLSNIAQRNSNLAELQEQQRQQRHDASTSSTTNSPATPGRITSSLFNSALTQALMSAASYSRQGSENNQQQQSQMMDTSEPTQFGGDNGSGADEIIQQQLQQHQNDRIKYANQLQLMKEMGLLDENINLQALILSNGEVETAVTLVLGGMNNLFN